MKILRPQDWFRRESVPQISNDEILEYIQLIEDVFIDLIDGSRKSDICYADFVNGKVVSKKGILQVSKHQNEFVCLVNGGYVSGKYPFFQIEITFPDHKNIENTVQECLDGSKRLEEYGLLLITKHTQNPKLHVSLVGGYDLDHKWITSPIDKVDRNYLDQLDSDVQWHVMVVSLIFKVA